MQPTYRIRRLRGRRGLAVVLLCSGWVSTGLAGTANAALLPAVDLVCAASGQFSFSPPLNNNVVSDDVTGLFSSCLSPDRRAPQLRSGVLFGTNGHARGCFPLGLSQGGTGTFFWSDGTTTSFTLEIGTNLSRPPIGFDAILNRGTLAGDVLTGVPLAIDQEGLCGFGGVRSYSFPLGLVVITRAGAGVRHRLVVAIAPPGRAS